MKVKVIKLESEIKSPCRGLADSLGYAIHDFSDVAEINAVELTGPDNFQKIFDVPSDNITVRDDGVNACIEFSIKDFSSDEYTFDIIKVMHRNPNYIMFPPYGTWWRYYFRFTGNWQKEALTMLVINFKLWVRG